MIDRAEIEEVLAAVLADPDDPEGIEERNDVRRAAVEGFLQTHPDANKLGPQGRKASDMILDDLPSYAGWERG